MSSDETPSPRFVHTIKHGCYKNFALTDCAIQSPKNVTLKLGIEKLPSAFCPFNETTSMCEGVNRYVIIHLLGGRSSRVVLGAAIEREHK